MTNLQAAIVSLITAGVGIAVGFGALDNTTAGIVTGAAATVVGALFIIGNAVENLVKAKLKIAGKL